MRSFMQRYPLLRVDLQLNDRFVDLVEEGIDIAFRIGELKESNLIARRIGATFQGDGRRTRLFQTTWRAPHSRGARHAQLHPLHRSSHGERMALFAWWARPLGSSLGKFPIEQFGSGPRRNAVRDRNCTFSDLVVWRRHQGQALKTRPQGLSPETAADSCGVTRESALLGEGERVRRFLQGRIRPRSIRIGLSGLTAARSCAATAPHRCRRERRSAQSGGIRRKLSPRRARPVAPHYRRCLGGPLLGGRDGRIAVPRRRTSVLLPALQRSSRAREARHDRADRNVHDPRDLLVGKRLDFAQDETFSPGDWKRVERVVQRR